MSLDKNININASKCKSCSHMATVTISPTLLTDREVTYDIHGHNDDYGQVDYTELYAKIENALNESKAYTDKLVEFVRNDVENMDGCLCERVKYEVAYKPDGTLVDYREQEVRIMCPANTDWAKQSVGTNGNANNHYIGFKVYAPDNAVSFKESIDETITDDTMYYFEGNDFAGIDEHGRKYSIVWLPVAVYDLITNSWAYFGAESSVDKYIGWYYSVEWYNEKGIVVEADCVRINLANEACYTSIEPSYTTDIVEDVVESTNAYTDAKLQEFIDSAFDVTDEDIEDLFK